MINLNSIFKYSLFVLSLSLVVACSPEGGLSNADTDFGASIIERVPPEVADAIAADIEEEFDRAEDEELDEDSAEDSEAESGESVAGLEDTEKEDAENEDSEQPEESDPPVVTPVDQNLGSAVSSSPIELGVSARPKRHDPIETNDAVYFDGSEKPVRAEAVVINDTNHFDGSEKPERAEAVVIEDVPATADASDHNNCRDCWRRD